MMEKLSRTKKYQELRDRLQNDAESQVTTKDLSSFQERLNRLDVMHFDTAEENKEHDPIHVRRNSYFEEAAPAAEEKEIEKTTQYTFSNEYLDEYINEVKQYNKEKGLLTKDDTAMNILENLKKKDEPAAVEEAVKEEVECDYTNEMEATIPFVFNREKTVSEVSEEVKSLLEETEEEVKVEKTAVAKAVEAELEKERAFRSELEKKNKVIEEKIEDVEDDLDEMEESMSTANKILNVVLVLLILALLVVLGVVVYWTLLNRGII